MAAFTRQILINKPVEEVFEFTTNLSNSSKIIENVISSSWITQGPIDVGSKFVERREIRGKQAEAVIEVIQYEKNKRVSLKSEMKELETIYHYNYQEENNKTNLTLKCEIKAHTFMMKLTKPVFKRILEKEDGHQLEAIKTLLEA